MLTGRTHELPQKSLQIKEDDKFFSRLLTKESSMGSSSFRVYYGGATGAVPFLWESQPGTPKHTFTVTSPPPLTPPPSYHSRSKHKQVLKKPSKSNLLNIIFPWLSLKKTQVSSSPSSLSLSSSCSFSSSSSYSNRISSSGLSSFDSGIDDEYQGFGSPPSTLRFGMGRESRAQ
ncbi:uncharacterized protein LOC122077822 [Macadamia integrifolia]|uniref:uncharacterized protein LOC122077822 n=1 Tax=Macadamia integrifolia TaxID=60698 RepID=UPI001C4FF9CE|nr:uncharacterized protein LOC122077822 [Macadamia integrifolia]